MRPSVGLRYGSGNESEEPEFRYVGTWYRATTEL